MIAPIFIVPVITSKHKIATQINDGAKTFLPSCEIYAGQTRHITLEFLEKDTKNLILRIQNIKPKEPIDAEIDIKKA